MIGRARAVAKIEMQFAEQKKYFYKCLRILKLREANFTGTEEKDACKRSRALLYTMTTTGRSSEDKCPTKGPGKTLLTKLCDLGL